jgi:hypothetical protein
MKKFRSEIGVQNSTTNAAQIKDWRARSILSHQTTFDQELLALLNSTGWIQSGPISTVTANLYQLVADNGEGEDNKDVGTQAKFTNILENIIKNSDIESCSSSKRH